MQVIIIIVIIIIIRAKTLNHYLFKRFDKKCEQNMKLSLLWASYTEVDWLFRRHTFKCLIEHQTQISLFLTEKESPLSEQFDRKEFSHSLAYLEILMAI
jgi:hypothetical protein